MTIKKGKVIMHIDTGLGSILFLVVIGFASLFYSDYKFKAEMSKTPMKTYTVLCPYGKYSIKAHFFDRRRDSLAFTWYKDGKEYADLSFSNSCGVE